MFEAPIKRIYNMGYKDCGGWFGYIPPRHKKRITKYLKEKNKERSKSHPLYVRFDDMIAIYPYRTEMYA